MRIKFSHFELVYPRPEEVQIDFLADTEFEKEWLMNIAKTFKDLSFQFHHPCGKGPGELNNPLVCLVVKKEKDK